MDSGRVALGSDAAAAVLAAVDALVERAPTVVVADTSVTDEAASLAERLRVPLLPDAGGTDRLLDELNTRLVVWVRRARDAPPRTGPPSAPSTPSVLRPETPSSTPSDLAGATGSTSPSEDDRSPNQSGRPVFGDRDVRVVTVGDGDLAGDAIDDLQPAPRPVGAPALVLVRPDDPARLALSALATATGARLVEVSRPLVADARATAIARAYPDTPWVLTGVAGAWSPADRDLLAWDLQVIQSGVQLPGGGYRLFPDRRLVAMYGSPRAASLGVLGEQGVDASIERARSLAAEYDPLVDVPVVPAFEIIATIATGGPGDDGDYSKPIPHDLIAEWVDAAADAGIYVILDLQPGRTDFLTQARALEPFLSQPHVGLALDPEWRLEPDQVHLDQIGSVAVDEVQAVANWLASLTRRKGLPQKLLLLHQFRLSMLPDRDELQVPPELAVTIQMDGQGSQPSKLETWQAITSDPPADVWFGWKNFYDEDTTLRSPADTFAVEPSPMLVSYQ